MWDWFLHKDGSGATIDGVGYFYDNAGNRTAKGNVLNGTTEEYTYDAIYQLKQVTRDGTMTEDYTYDKVGNRLTSHDVASYSYNSSNQLTSADGTSFTYDKNGNTATKTDTNGQTTYAWDFENRLTSVTLPNGGGVVSFKYDPFGRRIQKSGLSATTIYAYDGANGVEELNATGAVTARYVQGAGIDEPLAQSSTALNFYSADGLGSITSLTDSTGASAATFVYRAFGVLSSSTGTTSNTSRYTAREYDPETGLYYYRARYYSPDIGRFLSEDPLRFVTDENFFRYVLNLPTLLTDPFGLEVQRCQRPVSVAPNYPHDFLYSTDEKMGWGLGPKGGWAVLSPWSCVPGTIEEDQPYDDKGKLKPNYQCNKVDDSPCVESCIKRKAAEQSKKPPKYCLGKYQCQNWADDIFNQCRKECKK